MLTELLHLIKVPWRRSNNVDDSLQILANYNRNYVFTINTLNLREIARERHYDRDIDDGLRLYTPAAQQITNQTRGEGGNPWGNENLRVWDISELYIQELAPGTTRHNLRSARHTVPLKPVPQVPGSDSPISVYIGQYYRREFGPNLRPNYDE